MLYGRRFYPLQLGMNSPVDGATLARRVGDGAVSGIIAYGVLSLAESLLSNLHSQALVAFFLILVAVTVRLFRGDLGYDVPQQRIVALRAALFSGVISFVGALIVACLYLRQRR